LLSNFVHTKLLNPAHIPTLLRAIRGAVFPNNTLGPPRRTPSPAEIVAIKRKAAETIVAVLPDPVSRIYFGASNDKTVHANVRSRALGSALQPVDPSSRAKSSNIVTPATHASKSDNDHGEEKEKKDEATRRVLGESRGPDDSFTTGSDWKGQCIEQAERLLDVLGDSYMNRHLMFGIVELIAVRLVPEMAEQGVEALLAERLGDLDVS
jgi:hypothetical protein